jgi:hypothetical protein
VIRQVKRGAKPAAVIAGKTKKKIGVSSTPPKNEATPLGTPRSEPMIPVPPRPPTPFEVRDQQLTEAADHISAALKIYEIVDATPPRLTYAERQTRRAHLVKARTQIDKYIVHDGGRHKEIPDADTAHRSEHGVA